MVHRSRSLYGYVVDRCTYLSLTQGRLSDDEELNRLTYKLLKQVRKSAVDCKFDKKKLRELGFKRDWFGLSYAFVNKRLGVLIKFPFLTCRGLPSKHCLPTVFAKSPLWKTRLAVIQPIADTTNLHEAARLLRRLGVDEEVVDFHEGNIGWFRGKPIIFDW